MPQRQEPFCEWCNNTRIALDIFFEEPAHCEHCQGGRYGLDHEQVRLPNGIPPQHTIDKHKEAWLGGAIAELERQYREDGKESWWSELFSDDSDWSLSSDDDDDEPDDIDKPYGRLP